MTERTRLKREREKASSGAPEVGRFAAEEWEAWMKWDGPLEALSTPQTISPSVLSAGSTSSNLLSGSTPGTSPDQIIPRLRPVTQELITPPAIEAKKRRMAKDEPKSTRQSGKKISHNVIEKRYRSNLNDKIARLRDSVPSLRLALNAQKRTNAKAGSSDSEASGEEVGFGLKFNKATVLTKATEYIQQLEKQNQRLIEENSVLRNRLHRDKFRDSPTYLDVQKDFVDADSSMTELTSSESRVGDADGSVTSLEEVNGLIKVPDDIRRLRNNSLKSHYVPQAANKTDSKTPAEHEGPNFNFNDVKGMIEVPEEFRRFREQLALPHYAPPITPRRGPVEEDAMLEENTGGFPRGRVMSRLMIGSLACLMVMEGLSETEPESDAPEGRGLFALPQELLRESRGFRDPIRRRIIAFSTSPQAQKILPFFKISLLFVVLFYALSLVASRLESKYLKVPPMESKSVALYEDSDDSQDPEPRPKRPTYSNPREFFARQAIGCYDLFLSRNNDGDGYRDPQRAKEYRRRWKAYADSLPRMYQRAGGA